MNPRFLLHLVACVLFGLVVAIQITASQETNGLGLYATQGVLLPDGRIVTSLPSRESITSSAWDRINKSSEDLLFTCYNPITDLGEPVLLSQQERNAGVLCLFVREVKPGSMAEKLGLKPFDAIVEINNSPATVENLQKEKIRSFRISGYRNISI
jgi:hypothetical protein